MKVKEIIDFVAKTASNVCVLNYAQKESLNTLGRYLGRLVSKLPAASTPFIAGLAISVLSDAAEKGLTFVFKNSKYQFYAQVLVRVAISAGVFAAGTALTGGALVPAAIAGAKFGAFLLVADKIAKAAILIFKVIVSTVLITVCSKCLKRAKSPQTKLFNLVLKIAHAFEVDEDSSLFYKYTPSRKN